MTLSDNLFKECWHQLRTCVGLCREETAVNYHKSLTTKYLEKKWSDTIKLCLFLAVFSEMPESMQIKYHEEAKENELHDMLQKLHG